MLHFTKMNKSVGSAIEKIKLQEQDKETKLKEKREYDAALSSINRSIKDIVTQIENYQREECELIPKLNKLCGQLEVVKIRRDALSSQVEACNKELQELRLRSDEGISKVWELRSHLCSEVQKVSDECDIWSLLMKPVCTEPLPKPISCSKPVINTTTENEARLRSTMERRDKALEERKRLLSEPENGVEFVRIKNALRYSLEMTANIKH